MDLAEKRHAIRHLLYERDPAAAMAAYFAFHHPDAKTSITISPENAARADGFVTLSRTGMDLFRPFLTMRLPLNDLDQSAELLHRALQPGMAAIINAPANHGPLLQALFDIQTEEPLQLLVFDQGRYEPVINVLVTQADSPNGLPRFVVRSETTANDIVASAHLNWLSPTFAEIAVNTSPRYRQRGWGRSVVAAMVEYLLQNGRAPLFVTSEYNEASIQLAGSIGFIDSGVRTTMIQAVLRPSPA